MLFFYAPGSYAEISRSLVIGTAPITGRGIGTLIQAKFKAVILGDRFVQRCEPVRDSGKWITGRFFGQIIEFIDKLFGFFGLFQQGLNK